MAEVDDSIDQLAAALGLPADCSWLRDALIHPSYANERPGVADNQRLEFLGDSVLGLCTSELLFERFPDADEGTLTRMRAQLVNAESLLRIGNELDVSGALLLGKGAAAGGLRQSMNVVADAVEALIAAAFLHGGFAMAQGVCRRLLEPSMAQLRKTSGRDPKSELQERVQRAGESVPSYQVVDEGGPAHERWFEVAVSLGETCLGVGRGRSKRLAERAAAQAALEADAAFGASENPAETTVAAEG